LSTYSINEVELLTGVKAHTLRIWEKRYGKFTPHRTSTNIRYYDDNQVRGLLNVCTLLDTGLKISRIMDMNDDTMNSEILKLAEQNTPENTEYYVNALIKHMLAFDEPAFDKVCSGIIVRMGMLDSVLRVFFPFLRKTGVLWTTNNAAPAQEHFASHIIKRKLLSAIDGLPVGAGSDKKFILFLPPEEWHELGLMLADYVIRSSSITTIYLGQNLPYESLALALEKTEASHLLTFIGAGAKAQEQIDAIENVAAQHNDPTVLAGAFMEMNIKTNKTIMIYDIDTLRHML
jgi:MerR family transcriptional regulator, light-induced transcriptional regulator